jgi:hypothetical protein
MTNSFDHEAAAAFVLRSKHDRASSVAQGKGKLFHFCIPARSHFKVCLEKEKRRVFSPSDERGN